MQLCATWYVRKLRQVPVLRYPHHPRWSPQVPLSKLKTLKLLRMLNFNTMSFCVLVFVCIYMYVGRISHESRTAYLCMVLYY
ncbi:hypothetical protein F2Q70_00045490 [Brassica cretica]|uniref:Uncharacterized protein n=1 Tax=Brassica cretica TaxID=69181 RepID=A0A8S9KNS0_BRACR|nr:hypothetical protein F2Q70_00045490 [Brassica cretica]